jgi:hypothetical protein
MFFSFSVIGLAKTDDTNAIDFWGKAQDMQTVIQVAQRE